MTSRLARLCFAVAALVPSLALLAQNQPPATPPPLPTNPAQPGAPAAQPGQPSIPPAPPEDEMVQLKLPDADIDTVLTALRSLTGRIILRPQALTTATYNIDITKPIPKADAIVAIETVLALNGVSVSPMGDKFLKVVNNNNIRLEAPTMITGSALELPASGKAASKIFLLEFMRVAEFAPMIQNIVNPFYGSPIQMPNANAIFITDTVSNLQRIEVLLQDLDKPVTAGMRPKFYQLTHAKASDLVNKLRTILQGTLTQQLGSATTYSADDRTNQVVLVTDPRQHEFFDDLITRLDSRSDPNTKNDVIYLKHAKAVDVVNVLTKIIQGQSAALQKQSQGSVRPGQLPGQPQPLLTPQPNQPQVALPANVLDGIQGSSEFSSIMTVVNDERSNSIVVSGTPGDLDLARELIGKLDIVLAQVRIEVVIAEVTLDDNTESGIDALGLQIDGDKLVGFSGSYGDALQIGGGTVTRPGITGRRDLAAEISIGTTPRTRNNSLITVPAIVTSHGKKAKVFSGETRPVVTGTLQSAAGVSTGLSSSSTVTQQEIGTTLTVTPFIGVDGSVQLDLIQSVQDVTGEVQVDANTQYIIGRRDTENYVTAKSGEIIVLGGFRKDANIKERNRLGPIPIIGDIFGPRKTSKNRNELIFFLRPTVLTNNPSIDNAGPLQRIEEWSTRDSLKQHINPINPMGKPAPTPTTGTLDRILPR